jgi:beta-lactam-binding protein with PASTA domain
MSDNNDTAPKRSVSRNGNVDFRNTQKQLGMTSNHPTRKQAPKEDAVQAPKKKRPSLLLNIAAMAAVVVVLMLLTVVGLHIYTRHGQEIIVPDVKGMTAGAAVDKLEQLGLTPVIDDSVYVKTLPPGAIFDQSIHAGNPVKAGRLIHLTINSGTPPQLTLPDIADNSSLREATMKLRTMGFKLGDTEFVHGEKDWVYGVKCDGKSIGAGSRINADKTIVLVVGDGTYYDNDTEDTGDTEASDSLLLEDYSTSTTE